jgi:hypothetical protein
LVGGTGVFVGVSVGVLVGGTGVFVGVSVAVLVGGTGVFVGVSVGVFVAMSTTTAEAGQKPASWSSTNWPVVAL